MSEDFGKVIDAHIKTIDNYTNCGNELVLKFDNSCLTAPLNKIYNEWKNLYLTKYKQCGDVYVKTMSEAKLKYGDKNIDFQCLNDYKKALNVWKQKKLKWEEANIKFIPGCCSSMPDKCKASREFEEATNILKKKEMTFVQFLSDYEQDNQKDLKGIIMNIIFGEIEFHGRIIEMLSSIMNIFSYQKGESLDDQFIVIILYTLTKTFFTLFFSYIKLLFIII